MILFRCRRWNLPVGRALAVAVAVACLCRGAPAYADSMLTIMPTFDSSITGDPNAASIEAVINNAIGYYQSTFTTKTASPINVSILFSEMSGGLGQSITGDYQVPYSAYITALNAASSGNATDTTALAHLPVGPFNPVNGSANMIVSSANARALGFNTPGFVNGIYDSNISLNTSITDVPSGGPYSLFTVTEHEIDEALGFGSNAGSANNGTFFGDPSPEDLFRYDQNGNRSFTPSSGALAFFSLNGSTLLAQFDNQGDGGDYGDWQSNPLPGGAPVRVQDAFATPFASATLANDGGAEVTALDAIGYNLSGMSATPEPASLALLGIGIAGIAGYGWRKRKEIVGR
jgi:hypothetical protein